MSRLAFQFDRGGIHLPQLRLWLDPHHAKAGDECVFVSHAHSDHIGRHREVILTGATARFLRHRIGSHRVEQILPYGRPEALDRESEITLLPAGHIFGSAMALVETEGRSLLYTGDFKLHAGYAAETCQPCHADWLVMETTFGRPDYVFPPADQVRQEICRFCHETLEAGETPVLFAYPLGKSQELLAGFAGSGLSFVLHGEAARLTRLYEELGRHFPPWQPYDPATSAGKVHICSPHANRDFLARIGEKLRTAAVTGWALDPRSKYRYGVDVTFPLSDHADFPELLEFVKRVAPRKVFTLHGYAADFARELRIRGFEAQSLSEDEQLELALA